MRTYLKPLLVFGLVLLLVVLISWFAFPGWRTQPGGMALLIGVAAVGVIAVAKNVIDIAKGWRELTKPAEKAAPAPKAPSRKPIQSQVMKESADSDQSMKHSGGDQKQTMEESPRGKQHME